MTELNLKRQLVPYEWLQFPPEIKSLFKKWFNIPRTGGSMVVGDKVISDGHTIEDLSVVSLKSLQSFLHTDDDHWDNLLKMTINKMENYIDDNPISGTENSGVEQGTVNKTSGVEKAKKPYKRKVISVS